MQSCNNRVNLHYISIQQPLLHFDVAVAVTVVTAATVVFIVVNIVIVVVCRIIMQSCNNRINLHYMSIQQPLL